MANRRTRQLPLIDCHEVSSVATPQAVFDALWHATSSAFDGPITTLYGRAMGTQPSYVEATKRPTAGTSKLVGFEVCSVEEPCRLQLVGRHRFSVYTHTFDIEPDGAGSRLRATTHAAFPGLLGRVYRTAVIDTRLHVFVMRRMIAIAARRAEL